MKETPETEEYRFNCRRSCDIGPPGGLSNRRVAFRREEDKFRAWFKKEFHLHMDETITQEKEQSLISPVVAHIDDTQPPGDG